MSMDIRNIDGRDIASRIVAIQHIADAAASLVDAGDRDGAQRVLLGVKGKLAGDVTVFDDERSARELDYLRKLRKARAALYRIRTIETLYSPDPGVLLVRHDALMAILNSYDSEPE